MEKKDKYSLTPEEFEKCLKMAELGIFMDTQKSNRPTSVFVVSQPGAGKTGLKTYVEGEYGKSDLEGSFIEFNPDVVAIYHKYYKEILEEFPNDSYRLLQKFVLPALDDYLRYRAVQFRNNIIQEGTFASPGYIKILDFQKNGGVLPFKKDTIIDGNYFIDINVLAVHRFESLLSAYEREQYDFIENELSPRVVTPENHDRAYKNILTTLDTAEKQGLYSRIRVFKRGKTENTPELVYQNGDSSYENSVQALLGERENNKKVLLQNSKQYLQRIKTLRERIKRNKTVSQSQLERLDELEKEFLLELQKSEAQR